MEQELDKLVEADIEYAQNLNFYTTLFNYDDEIENAEPFCCEECNCQAAYFLKG